MKLFHVTVTRESEVELYVIAEDRKSAEKEAEEVVDSRDWFIDYDTTAYAIEETRKELKLYGDPIDEWAELAYDGEFVNIRELQQWAEATKLPPVHPDQGVLL